MSKGLFLCIEGSDGSGKATQHRLLAEHLQTEGVPLLTVDFPRYGQASAELVEQYLHGDFGDATLLDPHLASLPYAIDRLAASPEIDQALHDGKVVLANRFAASNMAHQGAKFAHRAERVAFFTWLARLEYDIMHVPQPDYHFVLHLPAGVAHQRLVKRAQGQGDQQLDAHEASLAHLQRAEQTYLDLAATFPDRFILIACIDGKRERTPQEIHEEIWTKTQELRHG